MMTINEFSFILNDGENQFVEFKESFDKALVKEIAIKTLAEDFSDILHKYFDEVRVNA